VTPADATARHVAFRLTYAQTTPRRAVPRAQSPTLIESDYARILVGWVAQWRASLEPLVQSLPDLLAGARRHRMDDTEQGRRLRAALERGRYAIARHAQIADGVAERTGRLVANHQKQEFAKQTRAALGVDVPTLDRSVPTLVGHFAHANAQRIQSLGENALAEVGRIVGDGFTNDRTADEIAADIHERFNVAESYARRLAHDQITKLDAQVARARHEELGIVTFRWFAYGDARPSHLVKRDRIFPYRGSRAPGFFPGEEYGCRCKAIPVFDEIRMKAGIGRGRQRIV